MGVSTPLFFRSFYQAIWQNLMRSTVKKKGKIIVLFATLLVTCNLKAEAQCPAGGDVSFPSQADINNFILQYPNCTHISGNVSINGNNISNLNGLRNLTSIGGELSIYINPGSTLQNLSGLSALTSIGGDFRFGNNSTLNNLDGLSNIASIGGMVNIT